MNRTIIGSLRRRLADVVAPVATTRDYLLYPFPSDWYGNTAIGSTATFQPAGITQTAVATVKTDGVTIGVKKTDPTKALSRSTFYYTQAGAVVNVSNPYVVPAGTNVYVPPSAGGDGKMNEIAVFLDTSDRLWEGQPMILDQTVASTDAKFKPSFAFIPVKGNDPRAFPVDGGHGGSSMTAFGLTLRDHEFRNITKPLRHALAVNLPPSMIYRPGADNPNGYRAPATSADGSWDVANTNNSYTGTVSGMKLGALLTWPDTFDLSSITNAHAKWIAQGIKDYGVYLVDATGTADVWQFSVEKSFEQEFLALPALFSSQLWSKYPQLQVVTNNGSASWGGGGTPRVATLPPIA